MAVLLCERNQQQDVYAEGEDRLIAARISSNRFARTRRWYFCRSPSIQNFVKEEPSSMREHSKLAQITSGNDSLWLINIPENSTTGTNYPQQITTYSDSFTTSMDPLRKDGSSPGKEISRSLRWASLTRAGRRRRKALNKSKRVKNSSSMHIQ